MPADGRVRVNFGWVLVTRAEEDLDDLREALGAIGFGVVPYPVLRPVPAIDESGWAAVRTARPRLRAVAFTSPRAPAALRTAAAARDLTGDLADWPAFAVGGATASAAAAAGFAVAAVGSGGGAELARVVAARLEGGASVLHACGRDHRRDLADSLTAAGIELLEVIVYAMELTPQADLPALPAAPPAAVLLTSPRAAEAFAAAAGRELAGARLLAMGATTAAGARAAGLDVTVLRRPSPDAVVEELCQTCS
jgi:uroporphyrinogen-III synthase